MENNENSTTIAGNRVVIVRQYNGIHRVASIDAMPSSEPPKTKLIEKRVSLTKPETEITKEPKEPKEITKGTVVRYGLIGGAAAVVGFWLYKNSNLE